jgi:DNA-binding CsgD family transcriptional regulator
MGELLRTILLFAPLIAGAIAIFFSFQLMKQYKVPFAGSYFYYLVFLYVFGAYSLAGSGILKHLLARMEVQEEIIHSASLYAIFLGIPFIALSKFMLLRSVKEFFRKSVSLVFTVVYFVLSIGAFVLYGVFMVRLTRFDIGEYQLLITTQRWVFLGFMVMMYLVVFLTAFLSSRKTPDHNQKKYIRIFGYWYLLFMGITCTAQLLDHLHEVVSHIFFFIFLSWHLIPILFLSLYLEKYHGKASVLQDDFESRLLIFVEKYEISKREQEVVRLICKGQSNQEISDSLFISLQTVKDHIHRIFLKTGVKNRIQLNNLIRSDKA